jgi:hypothetical protein
MSDKPIAQKLLIKENYTILLINEPESYRSLLCPLPPNTTVTVKPQADIDLIQIFLTSKKELEDQLPKLKALLSEKGTLWITYPKGTSKVKTDVNRNKIAAYAKTLGLQAIFMVSIDDTWSALRLQII